MERPWKRLYQDIIGALRTMPVLETWEQRNFKSPSELKRLPAVFLCQGEPMFQDLQEEVYLASEYNFVDAGRLRDLDIQTLSWSHILTRLQADLTRGTSRIRTRERNSPWYEAFAELMENGIKLKNISKRLKTLALICLNKPNQWTGAPGESKGGLRRIYFPTTESIPIPNDIGLHLADDVASSNKKVKAFYEAMGVEVCPKEVVFAAFMINRRSSGTGYTYRPTVVMHVLAISIASFILLRTLHTIWINYCHTGSDQRTN